MSRSRAVSKFPNLPDRMTSYAPLQRNGHRLWIATALFCLQMGFTAYAQLACRRWPRLSPTSASPTTSGSSSRGQTARHRGAIDAVPARLKEWAYAGFAITLVSALIAHLAVGDGPEAWGLAAGTSVLWVLSYSSGAAWRPRPDEGRT